VVSTVEGKRARQVMQQKSGQTAYFGNKSFNRIAQRNVGEEHIREYQFSMQPQVPFKAKGRKI
jgi:hypothetical protein